MSIMPLGKFCEMFCVKCFEKLDTEVQYLRLNEVILDTERACMMT